MAGVAKVYKGSRLLTSPEVALTNFEKARGLMFSPPKNILFKFNHESKLNFHMVFVFYPIDIVFIDADSKVVDMKKWFTPFTCYYCKAKSMYALEVEKGFIDKHKINYGDVIRLEFEDGTNSLPKAAGPKTKRTKSVKRSVKAPVKRTRKSTAKKSAKTAKKFKSKKTASKKNANKNKTTKSTAKNSAKKMPSKKSSSKSSKGKKSQGRSGSRNKKK